jgi:DNA-binding NarL/FixJ family response regulator
VRIAIIKSDRFSAEAIYRVASDLFPVAKVSMHHTAAGLHGHCDSELDGLETLAKALRRVAGGRTHFQSQSARASAEAAFRRSPIEQLLTNRELEIFSIIGDGSDDQTAADRLGLSPKTVHTIRQRIMHKLDLHTCPQLVQAAVRCGVVRFCNDRVIRPGFEHGRSGSDPRRE